MGRVRAEAVLSESRLDHAQNLLEALLSWCQSGTISPQVDLDALHDMRPPGLWALDSLVLRPTSMKKSAKPLKAESARCVASTPLKSST